MSLRGVDNESLGSFNEPEDGVPENWRSESPAESQELRWENMESGEVVWVESETDSGSPYAIFYTESMDVTADTVEVGFEDLDEAEIDAIKFMEEIGGDISE